MITLTQFIRESDEVKMSSSKLAEYAKLIEEYKKTAQEHGLNIFTYKNDPTETLWLSSKNTDALETFGEAGNAIFYGLKEEKWPLPYDGCDVHVIDEDTENPLLYFCMWLGLGPCDNPREQYTEAKNCYGNPEDGDTMYDYWAEHDFDNPDNYLDALIGQVKDILKIFPKFKEYTEED